MVSTLRCGRSNPGSNPGHGKSVELTLLLYHVPWAHRPLLCSLYIESGQLKPPFLLVSPDWPLAQSLHRPFPHRPCIAGPMLLHAAVPGAGKRCAWGLVAQWITRLPTEQKIAGSSPAEVGCFEYSFLYDMLDSFIRT